MPRLWHLAVLLVLLGMVPGHSPYDYYKEQEEEAAPQEEEEPISDEKSKLLLSVSSWIFRDREKDKEPVQQPSPQQTYPQQQPATQYDDPIQHNYSSYEQYNNFRKEIIEKELNYQMGGATLLTPDETRANSVFMSVKFKEYDASAGNKYKFPPALPFHVAKHLIDETVLYALLRRFPKGANLQAYLPGMLSPEILYNQTFRNDTPLYFCEDVDGVVIYRFATDRPAYECNWKLLQDQRNATDAKTYREWLMSQFLLDPFNPDLDRVLKTVQSLIAYRPIFEDVVYRALQELYDDNIMYAEIRDGLLPVYDDTGIVYNKSSVISMYKNTVARFRRDHPDFLGVRVIYSQQRRYTRDIVEEFLDEVKELRAIHGDFVAGLDLSRAYPVSQPLYYYAKTLLRYTSEFPYFLHAGDTNNAGTAEDYDLIDAIMLKSRRIPVAFTLNRHPVWMDMVKGNGIGIEYSPLRDQVFLDADARNHPHAALITKDFPVTVVSAYPGFWRATGLSYDWYQAFMGSMSRHTDIRALKQLALNSIRLSTMPPAEQKTAQRLWEAQWAQYVAWLVEQKF